MILVKEEVILMGDDMEVPSEWGNGLGEDETDEGVLDYYLDVQVMFP